MSKFAGPNDMLCVEQICQFLRAEKIDHRVRAWRSPMTQTVGYRHEATALEREYPLYDLDLEPRTHPAMRFAKAVYEHETAAERQALDELQEPHCLAMRSGGWLRRFDVSERKLLL